MKSYEGFSKQKKSESNKRYRLNHPEVIQRAKQRFKDKNPDHIRDYWRNYMRKYVIDHPNYTHDRNKKRLNFTPTGKQIRLTDNPRTGKCSKCKKSIGDEYINSRGKVARIKETQLHHEKYDINNPLNYTVELCVSCHRKIHCNLK